MGSTGEPAGVRHDAVYSYSERFIHSEAYRARPDVMAVVHSHSPTVIPFGVTQVKLLPIRAAFFYPDVPVFEIREAGGWTNLMVTNPEAGPGARGQTRAEFGGADARARQHRGGAGPAPGGLPCDLHRGGRAAAVAGENAGRPHHLFGAPRKKRPRSSA